MEQALHDQPGLTPQEILARAATDMERLIKLPSMRTELRNGRREGKYELNDGRWSLAATGAEAADEAEPPASDAGSGSEPGEAESSRPLGLTL